MNSTARGSLPRLFLRRKVHDNHLSRSIVSPSFQIQEPWQQRLKAPVFDKIKMGEYFVQLDKKFTNEYRGSAVDVDIFANNVKTDTQAEHMEELLHKLRRTPHTIHTPDSTQHAAVRSMLEYGEINNLVKMLDDRLNYGVFFDEYTAILTLDKLLEKGDNRAAARCAAQLMLQEEDYPLPTALGNLGCWRYYSSGRQEPWFYPEEVEVDDNPDEVIRVRVRVVPNTYNDNHFDLRDPDKILGKTFIHFNRGKQDTVSRSLCILGYYLTGAEDQVLQLLGQGEVAQPVLDALAASGKEQLQAAAAASTAAGLDVEGELVKSCVQLSEALGPQLIENQKQLYAQWNKERDEELQRQYTLMQRAARVEAIHQTKADLAKEEEKLFFFENFDRYEMEKEEKVKAWVRTLPKTDWNLKSLPLRAYYKKKLNPDGERKVARWEKREMKKGPPK